jgi:GNAT superfamily N-acetyltransferase
MTISTSPIRLKHAATGRSFDGVMLSGPGPDLIAQAAQLTGEDSTAVLRAVVRKLLVRKGVDWTGPILGEYLGLFEDSSGTFVLLWDRVSRQFVSHGAMFQSARFPTAGLVAHIRTEDAFRGLGLGSLVVEQVVRAGFENGAQVIVLATDDKLLGGVAGPKAANRLYARLGFAVLAEKRLADTIDWLMIIDPPSFQQAQDYRQAHGGQVPVPVPEPLLGTQKRLIASITSALASPSAELRAEPATEGDLAALFLLTNLCPPQDWRLKLSAWDVDKGPEFERSFVVNVRPALLDRDRLEDASQVLRDPKGHIVAVCAARQEAPFSRRTFRLDFYCLPGLFQSQPGIVRRLVEQTIQGIERSERVLRPCRLAFWGADEAKIALFQSLGFAPGSNTIPYFTPDFTPAFEAREYARTLGGGGG